MLRSGDWGKLLFRDAAPIWLVGKKQGVSAGSAKLYSQYLRPLNRFFGGMRLDEIHIGNIIEYRSQRMVTCGPIRINQEINTIKQILEPAGLWTELARWYKPMRKPRRRPGQIVEIEPLKWFIEVASTKKKWRVAYLCLIVGLNTTRNPSEILGLTMQDVDFERRRITFVEGTKTAERNAGSIAMTDDCYAALRELVDIAHQKGAHLPTHHVVLGRAPNRGQKPDPTKPATSFRKAWESIRREAAKRYPALAGATRTSVMRHTSGTMLAENPNVSSYVLEEILGHAPGSKMIKDHYYHARQAKQLEALETMNGLAPKRPPKAEPVPIHPKEWVQ